MKRAKNNKSSSNPKRALSNTTIGINKKSQNVEVDDLSHEQDDSDEDSEVEEEEEVEDDEDEDISTVPIKFYFLGVQYFESNQFSKALQAFSTGRNLALDLNPELGKLLEKSKKRSFEDTKIPPGSLQVQRDLVDSRYLLSLIALATSKVLTCQGKLTEALLILKECLLWFPRNIEANYLFGKHLLAVASNETRFSLVESYLTKAVSAGRAWQKELEGKHTSEEDHDLKEVFMSDLSSIDQSQQLLSRLLCQAGRAEAATPHLQAQGFTWRLSKEILNYDPSASTCSPESLTESKSFVSAVDGLLPLPWLQHLRHVFRPQSPFWSEHEYDTLASSSRSVGYFSYLYPMKERGAVCTVERLIDLILPAALRAMPQIAEASLAEWWVHSRPHCCGHQLHFDSDETTIENGGRPRHPIASFVVFVDGEVGGPTLVTDQMLGGGLATRGWMVMPRTNRAIIFDSKYLHGVVPGKGFIPTEEQASVPRRLTFMVGFWKSIGAIERGPDKPGPAQPFPAVNRPPHSPTKFTWPEEMSLSLTPSQIPLDLSSLQDVNPIELQHPVWEPIDESFRSSVPTYDACFQGF